MMGPNRSMKKVGRIVGVVLLWLMLMVTAAGAELAQTVFLASPLVHSTVNLLQDKPTVHAGFPEAIAAAYLVYAVVVNATPSHSKDEPGPAPVEDSVLVDTGYTVGFFLTFVVVSTGYLLLYVPAATWGAVKCTVAEEDWSTCWNAYMNRIFH